MQLQFLSSKNIAPSADSKGHDSQWMENAQSSGQLTYPWHYLKTIKIHE